MLDRYQEIEKININTIISEFAHELILGYNDYFFQYHQNLGKNQLDAETIHILRETLDSWFIPIVKGFLDKNIKIFENLFESYKKDRSYKAYSQSINNVISLLEFDRKRLKDELKYYFNNQNIAINLNDYEKLLQIGLNDIDRDYFTMKKRLDQLLIKYSGKNDNEITDIFSNAFISLSEEFDHQYYDIVTKGYHKLYSNLQDQFNNFKYQ